MKLSAILAIAIAVVANTPAFALTIPSDGSDGAFNPASSIEIDLSQATAGDGVVVKWDSPNGGNAGKGVYDPYKWAVVFKYSSVNIPAGVAVTFKNHASKAPVVWLVQGNVTIDGGVNLRGESGTTNNVIGLEPTEPGPGGFRGGAWGPAGYGPGYGIGGGRANPNGPGASYLNTYGNPQIVPLIGGSGGAAFLFDGKYTGGAGGGAILIAAAGNATISGIVDARGGNPAPGSSSQGGSGGAIRLIAENVIGGGQLLTLQLSPALPPGRIRVETNSLSPTLQTEPITIRVPPPGIPIIWPADNAPTVRVVSVDGHVAPLDPTAPVVSETDVPIENNGTVQVILETKNFPISGNVQVRLVSKYGAGHYLGSPIWLTGTHSGGDFTQSTWVVSTVFVPGFTTVQARATVP